MIELPKWNICVNMQQLSPTFATQIPSSSCVVVFKSMFQCVLENASAQTFFCKSKPQESKIHHNSSHFFFNTLFLQNHTCTCLGKWLRDVKSLNKIHWNKTGNNNTKWSECKPICPWDSTITRHDIHQVLQPRPWQARLDVKGRRPRS